jgi:trehalose-phosphatase
MADDARMHELERSVDEAIALFPGLSKSFGKKVFEIRSAIPWNKGRAVLRLLEEMRVPDALPIYIGDDTTDEDGFAAVHRGGLGVLVAEIPRPTEARWSLQDPEEVRMLLDRLTALGGAR